MTTRVDILIEANDQASKKIQQASGKITKSVNDMQKQMEMTANISKQKYEASQKRIAEETAKAQKATDNFKKSLGFASLAMGTAVVAGKKLYQAMGEGAEIELAAIRFDRLATSIGTTGSILREDLADATDGLMSGAEGVALATDLMSLGLAKTHDQAVRLTTVASQLGMNMNQLTLTLSNQTTMRFDSLGVAVDGFDEKLQKLKDSGMDVNDAFTEAFLQQAEEQIIKVGSVAETSAGKIMKFEAVIKDFGDSLKMMAADSFVPLLDNFTKLTEARQAGLIGALKMDYLLWANAVGLASDKTEELVDELERLERVAEANRNLTRFVYSLEDLAQAGREGIDPIQQLEESIDDLGEDTDDAAEAAEKAATAYEIMWGAANKDWGGIDFTSGNVFEAEGGQQMIDWEEAGMAVSEGLLNLPDPYSYINKLYTPMVQEAETQGNIAGVMFQQAMGEVDVSEAQDMLEGFGLGIQEAYNIAKLEGEGWQKVLDGSMSTLEDIQGMLDDLDGSTVTVTINVDGTIPTIGQATGGPLAPMALVGEQGPEMIINGVVVPAGMTQQLMKLGLKPGKKFATGGDLKDTPLIDGTGGIPSHWSNIYTPVSSTTNKSMTETSTKPTASGGGGGFSPSITAGVTQAAKEAIESVTQQQAVQAMTNQVLRQQEKQNKELLAAVRELISVSKQSPYITGSEVGNSIQGQDARYSNTVR